MNSQETEENIGNFESTEYIHNNPEQETEQENIRKLVNTEHSDDNSAKHGSEEGSPTEYNHNSAASTSTLSTNSPEKPTKASWCFQAFNDNWLTDPDLRDWIEKDPKDKYNVRCKMCDITLRNANKSALMAHKCRQKHIKNSNMKKNIHPVEIFQTPQNSSTTDKVEKRKMASVEYFDQWPREKLHLLVSLYANEEILWNTECPDNRHKEPRKDAFYRIAKAMDIPVDAVVKKITHLRSYYTRELTKLKTRKNSKWSLFTILDSFLHGHIQQRKDFTTEDGDECDGDDMEMADDGQTEDIKPSLPGSTNELSSRHKKKRRYSSTHDERKKQRNEENLSSRTTDRHSMTSHDVREDPDSVFGRHVANELRLIKNLQAKQFAKLQIHNILFNAQFGLVPVPSRSDIPHQLTESLKNCIDEINQDD